MSKGRKQKSPNQERESFLKDINDKDRACVLFYASWCYFSRRFLPIFEEYAQLHPNECLSIVIDDKPNICDEFAIEYYPTVILFKNGKMYRRLDAEPGIGLNKKQLVDFTSKKTS